MEKIELKYIVGYLPYGLKVINNNTKEVNEVEGFDNKIFYLKDEIGVYQNEVKPILRPLYDLTKEIEVNGEKFVPMERLLDIETKHNWSYSDYLDCESGQNEWWVKLKGQKPSCIFGYNSIMGFYAINKFLEKQFVRNQLEIFQKLYELKFDLHSLIEKNLAIDINTINKK